MNDTIQIYSGSIFLLKHCSTEISFPWFAQLEKGYIFATITASDPAEVNLANNTIVRYFGDEIKVINPVPDVEVYEDTPLFEVADLAPVFENVDQTVLTYTVETGDPGILLEIGAGNKLEMSLAANWVGSTFAIITAHNIYNQQASDTLWVTVNSYPDEQYIQIPKGWSGLSSWVLPHNPAIGNVLIPVADKLIILQNMNSMYFPSQNINTVDVWESQSAFKIKVTDTCTLRISGFEELNKTLALAAGWNLTPVISNLPVNAVQLFAEVHSDLKIAKDVAGSGVYWPEYGINSLGNFLPGKAYFVMMNNAGTIIFPENSFKGLKTEVFEPAAEGTSPWGFVNKTPSSHIIAFPESVTQQFSENSTVGAFTTEGICAGFFSINKGQNQVLVVNNDDQLTPEKDGFDAGEPFSLRIWDSQSGKESELKVEYNQNQPDHSGVFVADGISAISTLKILNATTETSMGKLKLFPNPTRGIVNIAGIEEGTMLRITVSNQTGQQVKSQILESDYQIDLGDYTLGLYFIKLDDGQSVSYDKIVLE